LRDWKNKEIPMSDSFLSHTTAMKFWHSAIFPVIVITVLLLMAKSSCATTVQWSDDTISLHPIARPGEHVRIRIAGLLGASRPVTLDIKQGKQQGTHSQDWLYPEVCIVGAHP